MNYSRIYNELINSRRDSIPEGYTEKHHVIPKCLGGSNDINNLVRLTAREHYIAHKLLWKMNPDHRGLFYAFRCMCTMVTENRKYKISSNDYELVRIAYRNRVKGIPRPQSVKDKISKTKKGCVLAKEHKEKLKAAKLGRQLTPLHAKNISNSLLGHRPWNKNFKFTEDSKRKMSEAKLGIITWNKFVIYKGEKYIAKDLCKKLDINLKTLTKKLESL